MGPHAVLPYRSSKGKNPKLAFATSRYANNMVGIYRSQSLEWSSHNFLRVFFRVPSNRSTSPLHWRWVLRSSSEMLNRHQSVKLLHYVARVLRPWSVKIRQDPLGHSDSWPNLQTFLDDFRIDIANYDSLRLACNIISYHWNITISLCWRRMFID